MKKDKDNKGKVSLLLSIIMLCVSLLVLCFGVYSVTNVQFNLNGNFTYTVDQVFATIETKVYASNVVANTKTILSGYANQMKAENVPTTLGTNNDAVTNLTEYDNLVNTLEDSSSIVSTSKKISVDFNNYNTYFVRIKVTNLADDEIWVAIVNQTMENSQNIITSKTSNVKSITRNEVGIIVVAYSIEDLTLDIPKTTFSNNISLSSVGADFPVAKEYRDFTFASASDGSGDMAITTFKGTGDTAIIPGSISFEEKAPTTVVISTQAEYDTYFEEVRVSDLVSNTNKGVWIRHSGLFKAKLNGETEFSNYENFSTFDEKVNSSSFPIECDFRKFSIEYDQYNDASKQEKVNYRLLYYLYFADGFDYKFASGITGHYSMSSMEQESDAFADGMGIETNFPVEFSEPNERVAVDGDDYVVSEIGGVSESEYELSFASKTNLKNIYLPKSIKKIGKDAFLYDSFEAVYIEDTDAWSQIQFYDGASNPMAIANYIYVKNESGQYEPLKNLTFSSNITQISSYAFITTRGYTCESITIPSTITTLNDSAITIDAYTVDIRANVQLGTSSDFNKLVNLRNLSGVDLKTLGINELSYREIVTTEQEFTHPVTKEGDYYTYSFGGEKYLLGVDVSSKKTEINDIPQDITILGNSAFWNRDTINSVVVPKNIKQIGINAFGFCVNLHNVSFEANSQLTEICSGAFGYCAGLNEIEIPEGVTSIGENAFMGDVHLFRITLPSTLTTISTSNTFLWCYELVLIRNLSNINLSDVQLGNSIKLGKNPDSEIITNAQDAFVNTLSKTADGKYWTYNCQNGNKKYVMGAVGSAPNAVTDLPNDANSIYQYAFVQQSMTMLIGRINLLKNIVIPSNIKDVGQDAFDSNVYISTVTIESQSVYDSITDESSSVGGALANKPTVYVPKTIVDLKPDSYMVNTPNFTKGDGAGKYVNYYRFTGNSQ